MNEDIYKQYENYLDNSEQQKKPTAGMIICIVIIIMLSPVFYTYNASNKLNKLIEQEAAENIKIIQQNNDKLSEEIDNLSQQKNELGLMLTEKAGIQKDINNYSVSKMDYNNQIRQLNADIQILDSNINTKQNELKTKIATKEEELRQIAEQEAKQRQASNQQKQNSSQQSSSNQKQNSSQQSSSSQKQTSKNQQSSSKEEVIVDPNGTVWIGDTGNKYHHKDCRTLRGNKYQITLEKAKAQGRTACKVCH